MVKKINIAPSLLAADYSQLGEEVRAVDRAGADLLHLDIMDGHFVPNISFGPDIVKALRPLTALYFDVHLMLSNPLQYIDIFHKVGANGLSIHIEAVQDLQKALLAIRDLKRDAGVAINPQTHIETIPQKCWPLINRLVIMTVEPGFGGQKFMDMHDKITYAKNIKEQNNLKFDIQIDGGITPSTAQKAIASGANTLVAGSAIFKSGDYQKTIALLKGKA